MNIITNNIVIFLIATIVIIYTFFLFYDNSESEHMISEHMISSLSPPKKVFAKKEFAKKGKKIIKTKKSSLPVASETSTAMTVDSLKELLSKVDNIDLNNVTIKNLNITGTLTAGQVSIDAKTGKITTSDIYSDNAKVGGSFATNTFLTKSFDPSVFGLLPKQEVQAPVPMDFSSLSSLKNLNITGKLTVGSTIIDAEIGKLTSDNIYSNSVYANDSIMTKGQISGEDLYMSRNSLVKGASDFQGNTKVGGSFATKSFDPSVFGLLPTVDFSKLSSLSNLNITGKLTVGNTVISAEDGNVDVGGGVNVGGNVNVGGKFTTGVASIDPQTGDFTTPGVVYGGSLRTNTAVYMPYDTSLTAFNDGRVGLGKTNGMMMFSPDGTLRAYDGTTYNHII